MAAAGMRVQMCCTSPPYWGLRDYGIEPSVWGGLPDCGHVWGEEVSIHKGGPTGASTGVPKREANIARDNTADRRAGQFCQCGAWLGTLGLEPDYRMYVDHIVEVMELVRDVLADDGTLWLNLGDSYATGTNAERTPGNRSFSRGTARAQQISRNGPQVGLKPKDMCLMPARVAIALQEAGWWVRQDIIWNKPSPMPESVTDRFTKAHEYLFLLSKSARYYFDQEAVLEPAVTGVEEKWDPGTDGLGGDDRKTGATTRRFRKPIGGHDTGDGSHSTIDHNRTEKDQGRHDQGLADSTKFGRGAGFRDKPGTQPTMRNKRSVWTIPGEPYSEAHFATFPRKLIEPCILAGSRKGDIVLDPFLGSGTTAQVAEHLGRQWIGCELNPEYLVLQRERLRQQNLEL